MVSAFSSVESNCPMVFPPVVIGNLGECVHCPASEFPLVVEPSIGARPSLEYTDDLTGIIFLRDQKEVPVSLLKPSQSGSRERPLQSPAYRSSLCEPLICLSSDFLGYAVADLNTVLTAIYQKIHAFPGINVESFVGRKRPYTWLGSCALLIIYP